MLLSILTIISIRLPIGISNYISLTCYEKRPHNFRTKFEKSGHSGKEGEKVAIFYEKIRKTRL